MARPYRPPQRRDGRALAAVTGTALASGLALAVAWHLADRVFELVILAPALVGLGIGAAVASGARRARLARPGLAAAIAGAGVVVALIAHLSLRYHQYRERRLVDVERARDVQIDVGVDRSAIEASYRAELERLEPGDFLRHRFGLSPETHPMSGLPAALGPVGTIGVYGVEVLIAIGIAAAAGHMAAAEPACPRCGRWRVEAHLAEAAFGTGERFVDRLRDGDAEGAAGLLQRPDTPERVRLALLSCPVGHDEGGGVLRVTEKRRDRRRRDRLRHLADLCVSASEVALVREAIPAKEPA